jgi:hypothetical protein
MLRYYTLQDGAVAKEIEEIMKEKFDRYQAEHAFDGSTETYKVEDFDAILALVDQYKEGRTMKEETSLELIVGSHSEL